MISLNMPNLPSPVVRIGGLLRYHSDDLEKWISDLRIQVERAAT